MYLNTIISIWTLQWVPPNKTSKPVNSHGHRFLSHPGKIIWEDRIITTALYRQCECWDAVFSWILHQSVSLQECNRKWNAKGKEFPNFSTKMWLKIIIGLKGKEAHKSSFLWNFPKVSGLTISPLLKPITSALLLHSCARGLINNDDNQ